MSIVSTDPGVTEAETKPRKRWALVWFRISITATTVFMYSQAVLAGQFLSGLYGALQLHAIGANVATVSVMVSSVFAILLRRKWGGPRWVIFAMLGLFVIALLQVQAGYSRALALHVPLGVLLIAVSTLLAAWSWMGTRK